MTRNSLIHSFPYSDYRMWGPLEIISNVCPFRFLTITRIKRQMNDLENYKSLVESVFGCGAISLNTDTGKTNNVIGALNNTGNTVFKGNFISRLKNLNQIYSSHDTNRTNLLTKIKDIALPSIWRGAYAELVALIHLNSDLLEDGNWLSGPIKLDVSPPFSETFASEFGKASIDLDGQFLDTAVFFDVKILQDIIDARIEKLIREYESRFSLQGLLIMPEYGSDIVVFDGDPEDIASLRGEFEAEIDPSKKSHGFESRAMTGLRIRLFWGGTVAVGENAWGPYEHARNLYKLVFRHAAKFHKTKPFFLVFCNFPWYNLKVSKFGDYNTTFYRAFSRRAFMQYRNSDVLFNALDSRFSGSETAWEISKKLSGIMFIEDHSILNHSNTLTKTSAYFYVNPNADNPIEEKAIIYPEYIRHISEIDNFEHDNY